VRGEERDKCYLQVVSTSATSASYTWYLQVMYKLYLEVAIACISTSNTPLIQVAVHRRLHEHLNSCTHLPAIRLAPSHLETHAHAQMHAISRTPCTRVPPHRHRHADAVWRALLAPPQCVKQVNTCWPLTDMTTRCRGAHLDECVCTHTHAGVTRCSSVRDVAVAVLQ